MSDNWEKSTIFVDAKKCTCLNEELCNEQSLTIIKKFRYAI